MVSAVPVRKLSYLTDNLVPRSPRSCAGLRKWRLRDWPTRRAQEGPLKLADERDLWSARKIDENYFFLSHILGFAVTVAIWLREVVACRHFILGSVCSVCLSSLKQGQNLKASFVHLYPNVPWRSPRIDCWGDCVCLICLKKRQHKTQLTGKVARDGFHYHHTCIITL